MRSSLVLSVVTVLAITVGSARAEMAIVDAPKSLPVIPARCTPEGHQRQCEVNFAGGTYTAFFDAGGAENKIVIDIPDRDHGFENGLLFSLSTLEIMAPQLDLKERAEHLSKLMELARTKEQLRLGEWNLAFVVRGPNHVAIVGERAPASAAQKRAVAESKRSNCATMAGYSQLQTGMSYRRIVSILGCEGEELYSAELFGDRTVMYMWSGKGLLSNMNVMLENDAMITKAQLGLK